MQVHGERPVFRFGDLSVDLVRRIVKVRDTEVKLSPKEYDLLRVLVQHAGKVLTHKFLLGELWDNLTDTQYLRVYVRQLRQKIEADPEQPRQHPDRNRHRLPAARAGLRGVDPPPPKAAVAGLRGVHPPPPKAAVAVRSRFTRL